jgi:hypothetical protein
MQMICCILHHRNELAPGKWTTTEGLHTAVIVNKYDINQNPLKFAILECLRPSVFLSKRTRIHSNAFRIHAAVLHTGRLFEKAKWCRERKENSCGMVRGRDSIAGHN